MRDDAAVKTAAGTPDLTGQRALVTGGGTGIGKACAAALAAAGADVTIAGPDRAVLDAARAEIAEHATGAVATITCDVTDEAQVAAAVEAAAEGHNLDIAVANAGTGFPGSLLHLEHDHWMVPLGVNVLGTAFTIKHAGGVMRRHGMPGTKASHGVHEFFRHGGSIGCRLTPGRVIKGKRMAGQLGNDRVTVQNLQLVQIFADDGCIAVRGSIPGATGTFVEVKMAATRAVYKRIGMGPEEVRSKNPLKASKKAAAGR